MTCWRERVYFVRLWVVGNSMCSRLCLHRLDQFHCVSVEDIDHSRLSDSHVEVVQPEVVEYHIRRATQV